MEVVHLRCRCGDQRGDSVVVLAATNEADVVVAAEGIWAREQPKRRTFSVRPVDEVVTIVEQRGVILGSLSPDGYDDTDEEEVFHRTDDSGEDSESSVGILQIRAPNKQGGGERRVRGAERHLDGLMVRRGLFGGSGVHVPRAAGEDMGVEEDPLGVGGGVPGSGGHGDLWLGMAPPTISEEKRLGWRRRRFEGKKD